jgi:alkanesulfonate monooxygenase SsuD/methylene tetrahydromethanopterin reductase-like flavin-dependent oxidoreductase (luciferase family)
MNMTRRGFGIAGSLDHGIVADLATAAESKGWDAFWANDTPGAEGLASLSAAARVTERIDLGVGVIPVDRTPVSQIAARLRELDLPLDRVIVGIGSGGVRKGSIELMRAAVVELRDLVPVRVYIGALGPAMCRLTGEVADGVLLNWLTPRRAHASGELIRAVAAEAGRPVPAIAAYVRVAQDSGRERLATEADRYTSFPQYGAHFARMGVPAIETTVSGSDADIQGGLAAFDDKVDEVILRAIVADETAQAYLALLDAATSESQT